MKHIFSLLAVALLFGSCSSLMYSGNTAAALSTLTATMADNLTPTKDPATGLYGYLNDFGVWVIPPQYRSAEGFGDGLAVVATYNHYGIIDITGKFVTPPVFTSYIDILSAKRSITSGRLPGLKLWVLEDPETGLEGYVNHFGEWVIAPQFESAGSFSDEGYAAARLPNSNWGAIDRSGKFVIAPNFTYSYQAERAASRLAW